MKALDAGADDYQAQAIPKRELVARAQSILRRSESRNIEHGHLVQAGPVTLDLHRHTALLDGRPLDLSVREFMLLQVLPQNAGFVLTRKQLLESVWEPATGTTRTASACIGHLRSKIEAAPDNARHFITIRGLGYRFGT